VRSPLTAGSIARIQLVSHAHMTVSVHLTRLAHAGHADLGPEDRLVLPTWQHTARPHTDHPVRDAVNAGKPTVGCRSERRFADALGGSRPPSGDGIRAGGGADAIRGCAPSSLAACPVRSPSREPGPEPGARRAVAGGVTPLGVLADGGADMASARYARG
jgi:hypothetical protein